MDFTGATTTAGQAVSVYGVSEFVPYNDPATRPTDPDAFMDRVDRQQHQLLIGDDRERQKALKGLRALYDDSFGRSASNDVSMMLYGEAIGEWRGQRYCDCDCVEKRLTSKCGCWKTHHSRAAILLKVRYDSRRSHKRSSPTGLKIPASRAL